MNKKDLSEAAGDQRRKESNVTRKIAQKTWNQDLEDEQVCKEERWLSVPLQSEA